MKQTRRYLGTIIGGFKLGQEVVVLRCSNRLHQPTHKFKNLVMTISRIDESYSSSGHRLCLTFEKPFPECGAYWTDYRGVSLVVKNNKQPIEVTRGPAVFDKTQLSKDIIDNIEKIHESKKKNAR
jgi:hypothetical protein